MSHYFLEKNEIYSVEYSRYYHPTDMLQLTQSCASLVNLFLSFLCFGMDGWMDGFIYLFT